MAQDYTAGMAQPPPATASSGYVSRSAGIILPGANACPEAGQRILRKVVKHGVFHMRSTIASLFLSCLAIQSAFAQSNSTDSLTITTYYPSPYGVYGTLKLHPKQAPAAGREGEMYYDAAQHVVKVWTCMDRPGCAQMGWVNMSSAGDASNRFTILHLEPTTPPGDPQRGDVYYDDGTNKVLYWNGTGWGDFPEVEEKTPAALEKTCTLSSDSSNGGIFKSVIESACTVYCTDKGFSSGTVYCADIRKKTSNCWDSRGYDFHECHSAGSSFDGYCRYDTIYTYCWHGSQATCSCN